MKTRYSQAYELFLTWLKNARLEAGLTQVQLAKSLDRPQSFIAKVEAGERRIDVIEFVYLCIALGIDPAKALTEFLDALPRTPLARRIPSTKKPNK